MKMASSNARKRGLVEITLREVAARGGFKVTEVAPSAMAISKGKSRVADVRKMVAGIATPGEIQKKNDFFPGKVVVLDWSPALA